MFRMSDFKYCSVLSELTDWITVSHHYNVYAFSPFQNIRRLNLEKWRRILELVAAVGLMPPSLCINVFNISLCRK